MVPADLDDEAHEVPRLLVEAERMQGPESEGGVADPAVAVVPVAFAAGALRQRGGGSGDDRPGGGVGEALEDERRALQVDPPGVVGEVAVAQPVAPELFGRVEPLQCLWGAAGPAQVGVTPGDRAESGLVFAKRDLAADGAVLDRQLHVAGQLQGDAVRVMRHRLAQLAAAPPSRLPPVGKARHAFHLHLGVAIDAGHRPQQRAVGLVSGVGAAAAAAGSRPLGDRQGVVDDHPAGVGDPGGLDYQRPRFVATADRHHHLIRPQLPVAGAAIEQGTKCTGGVEAGQAEPLDGAGVGDQGGGVAVGEEAVAADRWEAFFDGAHGAAKLAAAAGGGGLRARTLN